MRKSIFLFIMILMLLPSAIVTNNNVANSMSYVNIDRTVESYIKVAPPSVQMYYFIKKYCKTYDVPLNVAYKIAQLETNYKNPLNFKYKHNQTSDKDALGPMQVLLSTAREVWGDTTITAERLLNDVDFNVHTSIKYLHNLHETYADWAIVAAHYNSGHSELNDYAMEVKRLYL